MTEITSMTPLTQNCDYLLYAWWQSMDDENTVAIYESMNVDQLSMDAPPLPWRMISSTGSNANVKAEKSEDKFAGIPNMKANSTCSTLILTLKVIIFISSFILSASSFSLSVYNSLDKDDVILVTDAPTQSMQQTATNDVVSLTQFEELNETVAEMRVMLTRMIFLSQFEELNETVAELKAMQTGMISLAQFEAMVAELRATLSSHSNELNLYSGCIENTAFCTIDHNEVGIPPSSKTCETPTLDLEEEGFKNINIYCSVDNTGAETNPIVATLNIFGGEASCLCSLIAPSSPPIYSPPCKLVIQRCPSTLHLNP